MKGAYTDDLDVPRLFFQKLSQTTGVSTDRIIVVPGNHDMNLAAQDKAIAAGVFNQLHDRESVNDFVDKASTRKYLWTHMSDFDRLRKAISTIVYKPTGELESYCEITAKTKRIGFACLNSAWKATGAANDGDHGRLIVGDRQVENCAMNLEGCDLKIALMHHPLNWLSPFDYIHVQRAIMGNFDALFHGHNHISDASAVANSINQLLVSNAGCIFQTRDFFNGYSIVEFDFERSEWSVKVREYFEPRASFDSSNRFAPGGVRTISVTRNGRAGLPIAVPSVHYLEAVDETLGNLLLSAHVSDIAPKNLATFFVEPVLSRNSERKLAADDENSTVEKLSFRTLLSSDSLIFFIGIKESGKTTILSYCCSQASNPDVFPDIRFGAYVNLDALSTRSRAALLAAIVAFGGGEFNREKLIHLLTDGRLVLCLDNLPLADGKLIRVVDEFTKEFPKNKFIISTLEDIGASVSKARLPDFSIPTDVVYIHSFGRKQTRQLVEKWFGEQKEQVRARVEGVLRLLHSLNIPRSPFLISILLWMQERNIAFSPVNQAALIDAFVDALLEKIRESKQRSKIDATIKRNFLGELSLHMYKRHERRLRRLDLEEFAINYFKERALPSSAIGLIEELIEKGVLLDLGDEVCFKFNCFESFFLATQFDKSKELYNDAMSIEGFAALRDEIDLFTGLHRDRKDFLERFFRIVQELHSPVDMDLPSEVFDEIGAEESPLTLEKRQLITKEFVGKRPSFEQQEGLLDEIDEEGTRQHGPVSYGRSEPRAVGTGHLAQFLEALRMCSVILRNSELVNDAGLKEEVYATLSDHWSEMLLAMVLAIDLSDEPSAELAASFPSDLPQGAVKYFVKLVVPTIVLSVIRESLGTPKLEPIMIQYLDKEKLGACQRLITTFLMADLELPKYASRLESLLESLSTRYQRELVFFKVISIAALKNLSEQEAKSLEALIGRLFTSIEGESVKKIADSRRAQFLAKLREKGLIKRLEHGKR